MTRTELRELAELMRVQDDSVLVFRFRIWATSHLTGFIPENESGKGNSLELQDLVKLFYAEKEKEKEKKKQ